MLTRLFRRCAHLGRSLARALRQRLAAATKPAEQGVAVGALADLVRGRVLATLLIRCASLALLMGDC